MRAIVGKLVLPLGLALVSPLNPALAQGAASTATISLTTAQTALLAKARSAGAMDVTTKVAQNGGFIIDGKLEGDQFALAIPAGWQSGDGLVFAHGYSPPGTPIAVSDDPISGAGLPGAGTQRAAYDDGVAVGHSAYDKDGLGVETGVHNTKRLRDFLVKLGARRVYAAGGSMGGGIVEALLELYPHQFAGGLAQCGVVGSWTDLLGRLYDMRAAYNALTKGTPYGLPGIQDVRRSAISSVPPTDYKGDPNAYVGQQVGRIAVPILGLFAAAAKDPNGREARIIKQVAAIGGFEPEPASLLYPIGTIALGADDIAATTGGVPFDNSHKAYGGATMTTEEAKALNADIQRVTADPRSIAYLTRWHQASGKLSDPLLTLHNAIDPLVPYDQERILADAVKASGRSSHLAAYVVPPVQTALPVGGIMAYTHCGFSDEQGKASWQALRQWVETGVRPATDTVK